MFHVVWPIPEMLKFLDELFCHYGIFCEKQVVVLLEAVSAGITSACGTLAGRRPVCRSCSEDHSIDDIGFQVHDVASSVPFDPDLDSGLSQQFFALVTPVVDLCPVPVNPDLDPFSGFLNENSRQIPVSKGIHGDVNGLFRLFED